jgi:hypothetical protein
MADLCGSVYDSRGYSVIWTEAELEFWELVVLARGSRMEGCGIVADGCGGEPQDGYLTNGVARAGQRESCTDGYDRICDAHCAEEGREVVLAEVVPDGAHSLRVFDEDEGDDSLCRGRGGEDVGGHNGGSGQVTSGLQRVS